MQMMTLPTHTPQKKSIYLLVYKMLQNNSFCWFSVNHLVANAGKCHLFTSSNLPVYVCITNTKISNVERVKLLGVNLEGRLNFNYHLNTLLKKASKKHHALARVCNYMNTIKRRAVLNAFITSQFSYCLDIP